MNTMKRQRASSLVLVVVVMAVVVSAVFGASRLTLVQFSQANRDEDNLLARYAAKAGIEDGLLRFRFNRDAETVGGKVFRFNLTRGIATGDKSGEVAEDQPVSNSPQYNPIDQYYDMKMNFRVQALGDFAFKLRQDPKPIIKKDNTLELSGFEKQNAVYFLRVAFKFYDPNTTNKCTNGNAFVQIQRVVDGAATPFSQITARPTPTTGIYDSRTTSDNNIEVNLISPTPELATIFRFRPYYCDVAYAFATTTSPNGVGIKDNGTISSDNGPFFGGLITSITSTGYYGSAKRTLVAEIDRSSGQLISIYDFNIYSGTGDIKP